MLEESTSPEESSRSSDYLTVHFWRLKASGVVKRAVLPLVAYRVFAGRHCYHSIASSDILSLYALSFFMKCKLMKFK